MATAGSGYGTPNVGGASGNLIGLPNVTALRAFPGGPGDVVALLGYSGPEENRQDLFQWNAIAAPDDGVTRFNFASGNVAGWERVASRSGPLSFFWGGATGDGVTNDHAALQRVVDAAFAGAGGGAVFVPPGSFHATSQITIRSSAAKPVSIRGTGPESHLNIVIPGTDTNALASNGVLENLTVSDLRLSGTFSRGIVLSSDPGGSNNRVERCHVSGHTAFAAGVTLAGIYTKGASDVWVVDCVVSGGGHDNGDGTGQGYDIVQDSAAMRARIHFVGNRIFGSKTLLSMAAFDCLDSEFVRNTIDQNNTSALDAGVFHFGYGLTVYDSVNLNQCKRNRMIGNSVSNCAGNGIYLETQYDAVVSANVTFDTCKQITEPSLPKAAIVVNGGSAAAITGNVVQTCLQDGIVFTGPVTTVSGNSVNDALSGVRCQGAAHGSCVVGNSTDDCDDGFLLNSGATPIDRLSITGNTFTGNGVGGHAAVVAAAGGSLQYSTITGNTAKNFQSGYLIEGTHNLIGGNTSVAATQSGIDNRGNNTIVQGNVCTGGGGGVVGIINTGNDCQFSDNVLDGNAGGAYTIGGANPILLRNRFTAAGALRGVATLGAGGTILIPTAEIQAGDLVQITRTAPGGVMGNLTLGAIVAGVSFVINSDNAADTSSVVWEILH